MDTDPENTSASATVVPEAATAVLLAGVTPDAEVVRRILPPPCMVEID